MASIENDGKSGIRTSDAERRCPHAMAMDTQVLSETKLWRTSRWDDAKAARYIQGVFMARRNVCFIDSIKTPTGWVHDVVVEATEREWRNGTGAGLQHYFEDVTGHSIRDIEQPLPYVDWMQFQAHYDPKCNWI